MIPLQPEDVRRVVDRGRPRRGFYPLSHAQERMWLLDRLEPGSPAYNLTRVIKVRGALCIDALRASLQEITARHESLRTTFMAIEGEPVQVIAESLSLELPTID